MGWRFQPIPLASQPTAGAALGGSALTTGLGALGRSHTIALSGSAVTSAAGALGNSRTRSIDSDFSGPIISDGGQLTAVLGLGDNVTLALNSASPDTSITSAAGTIVPSHTKLIGSGEAITSAVGSGTSGLTPTTLVSQLISGSLGAVVPVGPPVEVHLNAGEMEMVAFIGSVAPASPLTTQAITSAAGTLVPSLSLSALSGVSASFSAGVMASVQDSGDTFITSGIGTVAADSQFGLTSIGFPEYFITSAQGTITATVDLTIALTGTEDVAEAGTVAIDMQIALIGESSLGEQGLVGGVPLDIALVGEAVTVSDGTLFLTNDRELALSGALVTVEAGNAVVSNLYFLTGQSITVSQTTIGPFEVALTGQEIASGQYQFDLGGRKDAGSTKGSAKKDRKPKKCRIEIDDQVFECNSREEAEELIKQAREIAVTQAKTEADTILAKAKTDKSINKVRLTVPKITGSEELKEAITDIYTQAAIDAEVALKVARARQLDEEESIVLLLME